MQVDSIKLLGQWVMVKEQSMTEITESGFILNIYGVKGSEGKKAEYFKGEVVAVSDRVPTIKKGEVVLFDCYSGGYDLDVEGQEYFITKPDNIICVLE